MLIHSRCIAIGDETFSFDVHAYEERYPDNEEVAFANIVINAKEDVSVSMIARKEITPSGTDALKQEMVSHAKERYRELIKRTH